MLIAGLRRLWMSMARLLYSTSLPALLSYQNLSPLPSYQNLLRACSLPPTLQITAVYLQRMLTTR